jgi:hypothetical protein
VDLVEKLEHISGLKLPEPAYLDDIFGPGGLSKGELPQSTHTSINQDPGQAIYEALSDEAKTAVNAMSDKIFTDQHGVDHSAHFAHAIRLAHESGPQKWSLFNSGGFTAFNVQIYNLITLNKEIHYVIDPTLVEGIPPEDLKRLYSWTDYPERLNLVQVRVGPSVSDQVKNELKRVNILVIQRLAKAKWKRNSQAHNYIDSARVKLALLTGEHVPAPSYLPKEFYGRKWETKSRASLPTGSLRDRIHQQFSVSGLSYTHAQIATFYTSLQTKGFVVLSGISGTGKSKIAQHFVEMLPDPAVTTNRTPAISEGLLSFRVSGTQTWVAIDATQSALFPPIDYDVRQSIEFVFLDEVTKGHAVLRVLAGGKPTLYLALGQDLASKLRNHAGGGRVYARLDLDDASAISRVRLSIDANDFVEGDLNVMSEEARHNNLFLAVRPDWRDSTSLLGYYNPLTETYEWTDFLRFILRAVESYKAKDGLAWFVILDDMNLAHVEYYFADLLSIIESGRTPDGFSHDPIRLTYPHTLADNAPPREVYLPPNLYIIGTVNMDETTHAFSPKVLDRAFTIELTDVDFSNYPPPAITSGSQLSESEKRQMLEAFTRNGSFAQVSKVDVAAAVEDHPQIRSWLSSLNTRLEQDRFHFGYRVFDEIAQFIFNADANGMFPSWEEAFDHAVFMKVLPKFNGSRARLFGPLTTLAGWAVNPDDPSPDSIAVHIRQQQETSTAGTEVPVAAACLPRVAKRALQMLTALEEDGFVSFG